MENVYDVVDVDQYSEMVTNRVNDDWIVDDDGSVTLNLFIQILDLSFVLKYQKQTAELVIKYYLI